MIALATAAPAFDYAAEVPIPVPACPLCGMTNPSTPAIDRYGFAVGTSRCVCGFGYLNPQLSAAGYARFYAHGYRQVIAAHRASIGVPAEEPPAVVTASANARGQMIATVARQLTRARRVGALLDVGGSTGAVVPRVLRTWPADTVTVLDPSPGDLAVAAARGYTTICASADDAPPLPPQDVILCVQTLDHVRDPLAVLRWMRSILAPGGWLYLDVVHAQEWARLNGVRGPCFWKLDHPCYWSKPTLAAALRRTGWRIRIQGRYDRYHLAVWCTAKELS